MWDWKITTWDSKITVWEIEITIREWKTVMRDHNYQSRTKNCHTRFLVTIENDKSLYEKKKHHSRILVFFWAAKPKQSAESILSLVSSPCRRAKMAQQSEHEPRHLLEEVRVLTEQMSQPNHWNVSAEASLVLDVRKVEKVIQARASINKFCKFHAF